MRIPPLGDKIKAYEWMKTNLAECRSMTAAEASSKLFADTGIQMSRDSVRAVSKEMNLNLFTRKGGVVNNQNPDLYNSLATLAAELRDINAQLGRQSPRDELLKRIHHRKLKGISDKDKGDDKGDDDDDDPFQLAKLLKNI